MNLSAILSIFGGLNPLKLFSLISLVGKLVAFIRDAEATFRGPGNGEQKLQHVMNAFVPLIQEASSAGLIPAALGNVLATGAGTVISLFVQIMNFFSGGVTPQPLPVPVPTPPPATPPDPTAVGYPTLAEAKNHLGGFNITVRQFPDGSFHVWPLLPGPGTQVFP